MDSNEEDVTNVSDLFAGRQAGRLNAVSESIVERSSRLKKTNYSKLPSVLQASRCTRADMEASALEEQDSLIS